MADSSLSDLEVTTVGEDNNDALLLLRPTAGKGDFFIVGELVHLIRIFAKMDDDSRLAGAIFVNCRDAASSEMMDAAAPAADVTAKSAMARLERFMVNYYMYCVGDNEKSS